MNAPLPRQRSLFGLARLFVASAIIAALLWGLFAQPEIDHRKPAPREVKASDTPWPPPKGGADSKTRD